MPALAPGRYGFHLLLRLNDYPFERHFCYMRPRHAPAAEAILPRRFVDMEFASEPPGIEVGPWPGWRGIPALPEVKLHCGSDEVEARYNFWGDERETGQVRLITLVAISDESPQEIEIRCTDDRLQPVAVEIYSSAKPHAVPMPVKLRPQLENTHPRLLFSSAALADLRKRRQRTHFDIWQKIEKLLDNWHLPFELTPESKTLAGPERLNDMDRVVLTGFHALITQAEASRRRAQASFDDFLQRALQPDYEPMRIDTQAGECLFTLSLAYDWLWPNLDESARARYRDKLFEVAERVWAHLGYEREDYAQAHFVGCSHGLLAFSFLFWNEHPRAQEWAAYLRGAFECVLQMLPEDGFFPHGINLWIYEHTFLLRYLELFRHCAGENLWERISYWKNASRFRQASLSPDAQRGVTFGDPQFRVSGDAWMHYLIAARTQSPAAHALGDALSEQTTAGVDFRSVPPRRRVWEFLFYEPQANTLQDRQTHFYFPDGGQFFWRLGEKNKESVLTFRAGAPLGLRRYEHGEWSGYGHSDPCHGSFLLAQADKLLLCGSGSVYRRDTLLNNTITIDGRGQVGDSAPWAPEFMPPDRFACITNSYREETLEWIEADLTASYLDFLGVQHLTRRLYVLPPSLFIIHDRIELKDERELQWNMHTYGEIKEISHESNLQLQFIDAGQSLQLHCILPEKAQWRTGYSEFVPAYPHAGERDRFLQLHKTGNSGEFLIVISLDRQFGKWELRAAEDQNRILALFVNGQEHRLTLEPE
ncbi:heparinase II/III family protein [bacterium]|nr:heparinase II/III family protein [bacterium]